MKTKIEQTNVLSLGKSEKCRQKHNLQDGVLLCQPHYIENVKGSVIKHTFPRRKDRSWLPMMCSSSVDWSFWGEDKNAKTIRIISLFIAPSFLPQHELFT